MAKPDAKIMIYREDGGTWRIEIDDPRGKQIIFYHPSIPFLMPRLSDVLKNTMDIIEEYQARLKKEK